MNKIKKIITGTVLSAVTLATAGLPVAKLNDKNSLASAKYYETKSQFQNNSRERVGKIVETNANNYSNTNLEKSMTNSNEMDLYIISNIPFMHLLKNENNYELGENPQNYSMMIKIYSTNNFDDGSIFSNRDFFMKNKELEMKKSILKVYLNEIYNGNVNLSETDKTEISNLLNELETNQNEKFIYSSDYATKKINAINSITEIIERNLSSTSAFYNFKLSDNLNKIGDNLYDESNYNINENSSNQEIAKSIYKKLFGEHKFLRENQNLNNQNTTNRNAQQINYDSNRAVTQTNDSTASREINDKSVTNNLDDNSNMISNNNQNANLQVAQNENDKINKTQSYNENLNQAENISNNTNQNAIKTNLKPRTLSEIKNPTNERRDKARRFNKNYNNTESNIVSDTTKQNYNLDNSSQNSNNQIQNKTNNNYNTNYNQDLRQNNNQKYYHNDTQTYGSAPAENKAIRVPYKANNQISF